MIKSLTITDYRNHASSRIITDSKKNIIITGPNGSGKTAILEAVSMLGGDRGLRGSPMSEISRFAGAGGFSVFAHLEDETELVVYFNPDDVNRRAKIDGDNSPLSGLATYLRIIWITPKEDRLFVDSVSDRRSYFDRLVASFDAPHSGRVARLSKLLSERGFALKSNADNNWLVALELQIAETSASIAASRIRYAGEINYFLNNYAVSVTGELEASIINKNATEAQKEYVEYLSKNRELVGERMNIDGVHKSDFGVFNKVLGLPTGITSTGQQKSALLDLIVAHAKLIKTRTGNSPLVLLDEADAHLDLEARKYMFAELGNLDAQVWATGINSETFKDVKNSLFVTCNNGAIDNIVVKDGSKK